MEQTRSSLEVTTDRGEPEVTRSYDAAAVSAPIIAAPNVIDRYVVHSLIGQGGFGQVFLAFDPQLQRQLAIKIPRLTRHWNISYTDAFLREARLAAQLAHPNVVAIHNVGEVEECGFYIAMEYIDGESLQRRLQRGRLTLAETESVIAGIAAAMQYAHKRGVIHRDLKPANVLIDKAGHVKVTDFGLAVTEELQSQHQGEVSGTPAYMSPEQVRGDVHQLDGRSDLWSVGVIVYECLTGRRPFQGDDWPAIREEILSRAPKPPRQIDDSIPPAVEAICLACLEKDPQRRPTTAMDVARIISDSLAVPPMPNPTAVPASWWWGCLAAAAIGIVAVLSWTRSPSNTAHEQNASTGIGTIAAAWIPGDIGAIGRSRKKSGSWKEMSPFSYNLETPGNTHFFDPVRQAFHIVSNTYSAFDAADQPDASFRLEAAASIDAASHFGVLWNIQEISAEPLNARVRQDRSKNEGYLPQLNVAYSACAAYFVPQGVEDQPSIRIGRLTFAGISPDTVGLFENGFVEEIPLERNDDGAYCRITVDIQHGNLERVHYGGMAVPFDVEKIKKAVVAVNPQALRSVGVLAAYGSIGVNEFVLSTKELKE